MSLGPAPGFEGASREPCKLRDWVEGAGAKASALLTRFSWETEDMGCAVAGRAIEPLAMLW